MNATKEKPAEPEQRYWNPSRKTITDDELAAFAERLHRRMTELGMTQSDLARKAFGVATDPNGQERVKDRDKVSLYLRGKGLPGAEKMRQLADALDLSLADLAPLPPVAPKQTRESSVETHVATHGDGHELRSAGKGYSILTFSQRLRTEQAAQVLSLLAEFAKNVEVAPSRAWRATSKGCTLRCDSAKAAKPRRSLCAHEMRWRHNRASRTFC